MAAFVIFASLGFFGAWLVGLFEKTNPSANVSGSDLLVALLGFLILIAALIGILLIIRRNLRPNTEKNMLEWKSIRKQGKGRYIRTTAIKRIFIALVAILWPLIAYYWKPESYRSNLHSVWIVAALFLAYIFGSYYAAIRRWDANERDYEALVHSQEHVKAYDSPQSK